MSVRDAAELLGLEERAVRLMAASGDISAIKRGNAWWLDRHDVERRRREPRAAGRPLSPPMAWSVLLLASGLEAEPFSADHHPARARRWLESHSLEGSAAQLRARARREAFDAHPSQLQRLVNREDVMRTGISAAELVGVHGGPVEVELYAPASHRDAIVDEHGLEPGKGSVLVRWMPDEVWAAIPHEVAPRAAVFLDLLEHDDRRARREAARALQG
jgi:excisionase family DNA binding protein